MYLIEWVMWKSILEPAETRKKYEHISTQRVPDIYEGDETEALAAARKVVSNTPKSRGPVYTFNDYALEIRCGMWESKRGLITTISAPLIAALILGGVGAADFLNTAIDILYEQNRWSFMHWYISAFLTILVSFVSWLYAKYGLTFSRLELFTSRHLLIRFNRKTQQVHLHRPANCGGIVTLPWAGINASATDKIHFTDDSIGMPLALYWLPRWTGTLHIETAWVGKAANSQAELRHGIHPPIHGRRPRRPPAPTNYLTLPLAMAGIHPAIRGAYPLLPSFFADHQVRPCSYLARLPHPRFGPLAKPTAVLETALAKNHPRSRTAW